MTGAATTGDDATLSGVSSNTDPSVDIVRACRILAAESLVEAFGHVSARLSGSSFLITPRKGLASVTATELLTVRVDVGRDGPLMVVEGDPAALPVEAAIHAAIYEARPDVGGIVRDHAEASSVLGICGVPIRPLHALGAVGPVIVPTSDASELVADWPAGHELAAVLVTSSAAVLRGNGRVVVGVSVAEACTRAILVEESARLLLKALSAGLRPQFLSQDEIESAIRDIASPRQILRVWEHYRTKHRVEESLG